MNVPKKIYDIYKELNTMERELMAIAVLQQGWGLLYCDRPFHDMMYSGFDKEEDKEISDFIQFNKVELAKAILNDDIHVSTFLVKYTVVDYIEKDGTTHTKTLYANKIGLGGTVDFTPYEESIVGNHEFTLEEIKSYGLDGDKYTLAEFKQ